MKNEDIKGKNEEVYRFDIGVIVLAGVLAGAGILYTNLAADYGTGQNLVLTKESDTDKQSENSDSENIGTEESVGGETESIETESGENTEATTESEKVMAVDFNIENAAGEQVNLYSFVGKPIVLNFWASWCGPCKSEIPDFQAAFENYQGEVEFLMVNMTDGVRETKEIAAAYMEEQGFTLPVYYDTAQEAAYTYGVYSLPTTYFIAPDGEIVAGAQGMIDAETLELGISMIYTAE